MWRKKVYSLSTDHSAYVPTYTSINDEVSEPSSRPLNFLVSFHAFFFKNRRFHRRMKELLGVEVPSDKEGVLQDVHWGVGGALVDAWI